MPLVNIKLIPDGITVEQKAELIKGSAELITRVLGKPMSATTVIIEEFSADNWGKGGESMAAIRAKAK